MRRGQRRGTPERDDERSTGARPRARRPRGELLARSTRTRTGGPGPIAQVPFGLATDGSKITSTPRPAVIEDGADESMFKLLLAPRRRCAMRRRQHRGSASAPDRRRVEIEEIVWSRTSRGRRPRCLRSSGGSRREQFGMIRAKRSARHTRQRDGPRAREPRGEPVDIEEVGSASSTSSSSPQLIRRRDDPRHRARRSPTTLAPTARRAVPLRGVHRHHRKLDSAQLARFAALAHRYEERADARSRRDLLRGATSSASGDERADRAGTAPVRADTSPETPKPGLLRRLFGRK